MSGSHRRVYLDHHATTPVDPRVLDEMLPYFTEHFGNPSSKGHEYGWTAASAVALAREQVASLIGAAGAREIVFTSGATESDNLAIKGALAAHAADGGHVVTTALEHSAVLDPCRRLEQQGFHITLVAPDDRGMISAAAIASAIRPDTRLVSVMLVNHEIGTIQPIGAIGEITRGRGILLHCDAAQALGRVPIDVEGMNVDLLSMSAHKAYGPKGCGALYVRSRRPKVRLVAQIDGGRQERSLRSGTLNVPGIVGFGKACEILSQEGERDNARVMALRERLWQRMSQMIDGIALNGDAVRRVAGNLNVSFERVDAARLVSALHDVAVSNGAACASGEVAKSSVLLALKFDEVRIKGALRLGLGRFNTEEEIDHAASRIAAEVRRQRDS